MRPRAFLDGFHLVTDAVADKNDLHPRICEFDRRKYGCASFHEYEIVVARSHFVR